MAVDEIEPSVVPLEQLRRERAEIFGRIGEGPVDPTWEYRQISGALAREQHYRKGAEWRLDKARESLHDLGPIGRHLLRSQPPEPEARIAGFATDLARQDRKGVGMGKSGPARVDLGGTPLI